ncbi:MAG: hypothetical protein ACXWC9_02905 [Pseudobdellovibrionaceae bacterium]
MKSSTFLKNWAIFTSIFAAFSSNAGPPTAFSPAPSNVERYQYGHRPFPGEVSELPPDFQPINLDLKSFSHLGRLYAPIDFLRQELSFTFDIRNQKARAHSVIYFELAQLSFPYLQLTPSISKATLDDHPVSTTRITDPDRAGENFIGLSQVTSAGLHKLEIEYQLKSDSLTFSNGGIALLTDMFDIVDAHFFETWGPTGFEDDPFELLVNLEIQGAKTAHKLFTNGQVTSQNESKWKIQFPKYFTTSSFYFHLTNKSLPETRLMIQGIEKRIPVTIYSNNQTLNNQAGNRLSGLFREFERDFGPYPHDSFTAYIKASGGGMEYAGATISTVAALDHELFHSWFARGTMAAEGRSGWIDEGFAAWRDQNYFQAPSLLSRAPTFLANASPFKKATPGNCYRDGRQMMAELDRVFAEFGGMKPLMRLFFKRYKYRVITTEEFWNFLNTKTGINVDAYFYRYALGESTFDPEPKRTFDVFPDSLQRSKHPPPLTPAEVEQLR